MSRRDCRKKPMLATHDVVIRGVRVVNKQAFQRLIWQIGALRNAGLISPHHLSRTPCLWNRTPCSNTAQFCQDLLQSDCPCHMHSLSHSPLFTRPAASLPNGNSKMKPSATTGRFSKVASIQAGPHLSRPPAHQPQAQRAPLRVRVRVAHCGVQWWARSSAAMQAPVLPWAQWPHVVRVVTKTPALHNRPSNSSRPICKTSKPCSAGHAPPALKGGAIPSDNRIECFKNARKAFTLWPPNVKTCFCLYSGTQSAT